MSDAQTRLEELLKQFSDRRIYLAEIQVEEETADEIRLMGKVLDAETLARCIAALNAEFPQKSITTGHLIILRKSPPIFRYVGVNLTSVHASSSWLAEMLSQVFYGARLEILMADGEWVFTRQDDGYLGWVYLPYLVSEPTVVSTHLVRDPWVALHEAADANSAITTRLFAGTAVSPQKIQGDWAYLPASAGEIPCRMPGGWLPASALLKGSAMPHEPGSKRDLILQTAYALYGVPYLWGGCSAGGIDCSGLARLTHQLAGINIPRDADMQKDAGRPVERPFQPGDLIFFHGENDPGRITHVAISLGGDRVIHSSRLRNGVYIDMMQTVPHLRDDFAGAVTYCGD